MNFNGWAHWLWSGDHKVKLDDVKRGRVVLSRMTGHLRDLRSSRGVSASPPSPRNCGVGVRSDRDRDLDGSDQCRIAEPQTVGLISTLSNEDQTVGRHEDRQYPALRRTD